jgi:hypothetical protein
VPCKKRLLIVHNGRKRNTSINRLLKKSACFVVVVARHCGVHAKVRLIPRFSTPRIRSFLSSLNKYRVFQQTVNIRGGLLKKKRRRRRKPDFVIPLPGRRPFIWVRRCRRPQAANPFRPSRREKGRAILDAEPIWPCTGRGLPSPAGRPAGWWALTPPFHPCPQRKSKRAVSFSVALSLGSPPVAVSDLPALRCPDFPPPISGGRLASSGVFYILTHYERI